MERRPKERPPDADADNVDSQVLHVSRHEGKYQIRDGQIDRTFH